MSREKIGIGLVMSARSLKKKSQTNWQKVDSLGDDLVDTSDIGPLSKDFFKHAELSMRSLKKLRHTANAPTKPDCNIFGDVAVFIDDLRERVPGEPASLCQ